MGWHRQLLAQRMGQADAGILWALAVTLGTLAGAGATTLPAWALAALAALASTLRGRPRVLLLLVLVAAAGGRLRILAPARAHEAIDLDRPVVCVIELQGWRSDELGPFARGRVFVVAQGGVVVRGAFPVLVSAPHGGEYGGEPLPSGRVRVRGRLEPGADGAAGHPGSRPLRLSIKSRLLHEALDRSGGLNDRRRALVARLFPPGSPCPRGCALARAFILGDTAALEPELVLVMRRNGLAHLLAVSGLHLSLLLGGAALLARPSGPGFGLLVGAVAVGAYALVVGPLPSLLRAVAMAGMVLLGRLVRRPVSAAHALGAGVAVLVLGEPWLVFELGFQLSVAATAAVLLLAPAVNRRLEGRARSSAGLTARLARRARQGVVVSACALVATIPWTVPLSGLVSSASVIWNLLAVPWSALMRAACGVVSALALALGEPLLSFEHWLAAAAAPIWWLAAERPGLPFDSAVPPSRWLALAPLVVLAWLLLPGGRWRKHLVPEALALAVVVVGCPSSTHPPGSPGAPPGLEVALLDVGQGDAILVRSGDATMLVDGGGWRRGLVAASVLVPELARLGVRRLDAVVLSHGDLDHCRGLLELSFLIPIDAAWLAAAAARDGDCVAGMVRRFGPRVRWLAAGDRVENGALHAEVLWPEAAAAGAPPSTAADNDRSLVLRVAAGGMRLLLTGDVSARVERLLVARGDLAAQVLKVAHHGSRSSTSEAFLAAVAPRCALVSAGRGNPFGHPSPLVLERLARRRFLILRTDLDGRVVLQAGAAGPLRVRTERSRRVLAAGRP